MIRWIGGIFDRLFACLGAFLFAQIPLYMIHYQQQLIGHVNELRMQLGALQKAAEMSGKTLPDYARKFLESSDMDFQKAGEWMQGMIHRLSSFQEALNALDGATAFSKPFVFFKYFNVDVGESTLKTFSWGIPFTTEGAVFAFCGILIAWATTALIKACFRKSAKLVT